MADVTDRELRDDLLDVMRRVVDGEEFDVTVDGRPVARLLPLPGHSPAVIEEIRELLTEETRG
ncbi:type II toxin-antitoxin system Phd/YefM family antitoxin [Pseudonocardia nigra]|uniref:type II toxin-antitoxin system Phd/YefM family antitoxin n=1 Tax=Pseudonocardia nigra TaxID=1921578 RepID=UPI001C5DAF59|nr:type II toxin-antitoxin system prevent-host-death family antitoxin [Pseudonocardia nigra]